LLAKFAEHHRPSIFSQVRPRINGVGAAQFKGRAALVYSESLRRRDMNDFKLRVPRDDDWAAILTLAKQSLSELPSAPGQQEWLDNRRSFPQSNGTQQHFVATVGERVVGYVGVEHRNTAPDGDYRLFLVVAPSARATLGTSLLATLRECLIALGARRAWFQELEADAGFISYLQKMGFVRVATFGLDDGTGIVRLAMDAPFQSLSPT
jgi:Acetyltransferase (GNAT) family